jgi:hypothetical protein
MTDEITYLVSVALFVVPLVLLVFWLVRVMEVSWMIQSALLSLTFT